MKNYDELINKFLDNEIESTELNEFDNLVKTDSNFKMNFVTHKFVHENLYDIPIQIAPENITESIMSKIFNSISVKYKKSYFFRGIVSLFILMLITSLFLFFFYALNIPFVQNSLSNVKESKNFIQPFFTILNKVLTSELFKTISASIGFIILLSFYFSLNSFKDFKNRMKQF
ncbi:MAG: hypothetical protein IPM32_08560 [Ignavibacteriae bacterium]|nr:hypothetical protein [Ignavibacteriota bacterium]